MSAKDQAGDRNPQLPGGLTLGRLAMAAFLLIVIGREAGDVVGGHVHGPRALIVFIASVVLAAAWLDFWFRFAGGRDQVLTLVPLALVGFACVFLVEANPLSGIYPMYYLAVVAGTAYRWRIGIVVVALVCGGASFLWLDIGGAWTLQVPVIVGLLGGSAVIVRRYVSAYVELEAARERLRHLAAAEARADLARDLHDRVGQQLSAVILQGELLSMDLETSGTAEAKTRAATVVKTARDALQGMREVVARERGPRLATEVEVARQLLEASDLACSINVRTDDIPRDADEILAWVIREGTSNILRHSGATGCEIVVSRDGDDAVIELSDNGQGLNGSIPGNGLRGLEERLAKAGGTLQLSAVESGGARLRAVVSMGASR